MHYWLFASIPLVTGLLLHVTGCVLVGSDWNYTFAVLWAYGPPSALTGAVVYIMTREAEDHLGV